jgi:nitrogen fixation protein NifZ
MAPSSRATVCSPYRICSTTTQETGDSAIPGVNPGDLLAPAGTRGMVVNVGHAEAAPEDEIYLVSFETGPNGSLAEPIGCLAGELSYQPVAP